MKTQEDQRLIDLRHRGATWGECVDRLGGTPASLRGRASRLRDAKQWTLVDGSAAKGAPKAGRLGRPRNKIPTVPVSPRFAPDVAAALRVVAACAGVRLGVVITTAMRRAVDRANGIPLEQYPLGLEPGKPFDLADSRRDITVGVNVSQPAYDALVKHSERLWIGAPINTAVTYAAHDLLRDLNYQLVEESDG